MTKEDNRGTADFLKEESLLKSMLEWRESVKDRPERKYERTWMTLTSAFGFSFSGIK